MTALEKGLRSNRVSEQCGCILKLSSQLPHLQDNAVLNTILLKVRARLVFCLLWAVCALDFMRVLIDAVIRLLLLLCCNFWCWSWGGCCCDC